QIRGAGQDRPEQRGPVRGDDVRRARLGRRGERDRARPRRRDRVQARDLRPRTPNARCHGSLDLGVRRRDHRAARMKTLVLNKPLASVETPLLAVLVAQGSVPKIEENLQRAIASGDYKGKKDETLLVYGSGTAERVLLVGVGKVSEITRTSIRRAAAIAAKRARSLGTKTLALAIAKEARGSLGAAQHQFGVTILDLAQIKKEGMGALLAVAQGSAEEPRFIVLEYSGGTGAPIALIGKGVTFDSGGISIKPALNMEDMKFDKSGAT